MARTKVGRRASARKPTDIRKTRETTRKLAKLSTAAAAEVPAKQAASNRMVLRSRTVLMLQPRENSVEESNTPDLSIKQSPASVSQNEDAQGTAQMTDNAKQEDGASNNEEDRQSTGSYDLNSAIKACKVIRSTLPENWDGQLEDSETSWEDDTSKEEEVNRPFRFRNTTNTNSDVIGLRLRLRGGHAAADWR